MDNKEYLNEKNYHKVKKGLVIIAILIMLAGIIGGSFIIKKGLEKNKTSNDTEALSKEKLETQATELESKIDTVESQLTSLQREKFEVFQENGFSDSYYAIEDKMSELEKQKSDLQIQLGYKNNEIFKLDRTLNSDVLSDANKTFGIIPGIAAILFSLIIGLGLLSAAFGRNILAWKVQQIMPVAQEGIEKIAPTVEKVVAPMYGNIAKEVAKGIKDGLKDDEKANK